IPFGTIRGILARGVAVEAVRRHQARRISGELLFRRWSAYAANSRRAAGEPVDLLRDTVSFGGGCRIRTETDVAFEHHRRFVVRSLGGPAPASAGRARARDRARAAPGARRQ